MKRYKLLGRKDIKQKCGCILAGYSIVLNTIPMNEQFFDINSLDVLRNGDCYRKESDINVDKLIKFGLEFEKNYGYIPVDFFEEVPNDNEVYKVKEEVKEFKEVRIKTWDTMNIEFGGGCNSINCEYGFNRTMENALPTDRIIKLYGFKYNEWTHEERVFSISEDMIETYIERVVEEKEYIEISEPKKKSKMKYIEVKADVNDGDYVTEMTKVDDDINFELLMMMFKTVKMSNNRHNFTTNDLGSGGYDMLIANKFEEDDIEMFMEFIPYDEYGIHTIESIKIYDVKEVIDYMGR